jgi:hypothetical protein
MEAAIAQPEALDLPVLPQWRKSADSLASSNPAWSSHFYDCALELDRLIGEQ